MIKQNVLVVEDDDIQRAQIIRAVLRDQREVLEARSGEQALELLENQRFDLVISDLRMPGISGLELVGKIKDAYPHTSLLVMTGHGTIDSAIAAMKLGVEDYLTKPFGSEELNIVLEKIFEKRDLLAENVLLREQIESQFSFANIISKNHKMQKIFKTIGSIAPTDSTVLIQGETGTGKELIAKAIHFHSLRKGKRFVAVDCGALPDNTLLETELFGHEKGAFTSASARRIGKLEYADGGTVLLDEIGNMSQVTQMKVLRALEEKQFQRLGSNTPIKVDIRLIAATNADLQALVRAGQFRGDLYYRLSVIPLQLPPLRERLEDIPLLARHFLKIHGGRGGRTVNEITHDAIKSLMKYTWPGNVRELENVIERAVATVSGNCIDAADLPDFAETGSEIQTPNQSLSDEPLSERVSALEKEYLAELLGRVGGKTDIAAEKAGLSLRTLQRKLKEYGIRPGDRRS